jgi:hypothetical protein
MVQLTFVLSRHNIKIAVKKLDEYKDVKNKGYHENKKLPKQKI